MRTLFADSGYWIALLYESDQLHQRAGAVAVGLSDVKLVTTHMVLVEVFNHASRMRPADRRLAIDFIRLLEADEQVEIIPQTAEQFRAAAQRYAERPDQRWSLTDCASFLVMEERGISEALAYDRDFEQAGFVALLRE